MSIWVKLIQACQIIHYISWSITGNVGAGHWRSTNSVSGIRVSDPSGSDGNSRRKDVDAGSIVGERGSGVADVCRTDSDCLKDQQNNLNHRNYIWIKAMLL